MSENFEIREGYRARLDNSFFDDTSLKDEWQKEVYEKARHLSDKINARRIADVGCGSGFKLINYFSHLKTIGLDLEPTLSFLNERYPLREWRESDFHSTIEPVDIVICADVVEHIPDPNLLMEFLHRIDCRFLVLSTPERNLAYGFDHDGPPNNISHCREWTSDEFKSYVSRWFTIVESSITNHEQATQAIVCKPKRRRLIKRIRDRLSAWRTP